MQLMLPLAELQVSFAFEWRAAMPQFFWGAGKDCWMCDRGRMTATVFPASVRKCSKEKGIFREWDVHFWGWAIDLKADPEAAFEPRGVGTFGYGHKKTASEAQEAAEHFMRGALCT